MNASLRSERLLQYYLATLFEAGISLVQALTALYEKCDPERQRNLRRVI